MEGEFLLNSSNIHAGQCTSYYRVRAAKMGWGRFAGTGDKASAGNRVTAGKAAIGARHIAIVAAFQIDFEVLAEWGTQLVPRRLEVSRLHLRHILSPVACWSVRLRRAKCIYTSDSDTAT